MSVNLPDKSERLKAIESGKGIQYILDEAYRILGNPILMHDMEYKVIAYTEGITTDDPIWNEFVTDGTVSDKTIKLFKEEGFIDAVANTRKITLMISDRLKHERISGKIFVKDNIRVANLVVVACNKRFEIGDYPLIETLCEIVSAELCKSEFYQSYGQTYQEDLLKKLIEGSIEDQRLYMARIENISEGLKDYFYLAVAEGPLCDAPEYAQLAYFRDQFKQVQGEFKYIIYSNYIVIIMSTDAATLNIKRDLKKLNQFFVENNIYAGVSNRFHNLFELRKYYIEAVNALRHGLKMNESQWFFSYDGAGQDVSGT